MITRKRIKIEGIVQGVGFRPFVYNLARRLELTGWVRNDSFGVTIEAQGRNQNLQRFLEELKNHPPILSSITHLNQKEIPPDHDMAFVIKKSQRHPRQFTLISPDIATCPECLQELFNPADRRFRYPFINCTNCGPRFTIVQDIPYDRPKTTMAEFRMCPQCLAEYRNPADRRFHAQPNACPHCGPEVCLVDREGNKIGGDPFQNAARLIQEGAIVAVKGLGGFHLAVDATNEEAVTLLRQRKLRYEKPLAIMSRDVALIKSYALVTEREEEILLSPQRPIVLLPKKPGNTLAPSISPDNEYFGVMLPYTPVHHLLMGELSIPAIVMTSGNLSEEPIAFRNEDARNRLGHIADYFLMNNRDIYQRADDSVVRLVSDKIAYIRRSRGFVPRPIMINRELPSVLAVGGELKNTICLNKKRFFFLSQHIGDLENLETLTFFEESISHLKKILEIEPRALAYDLHPEYLSTKWAKEQRELPLMGIQHHHAHIASCMAEYGLTGKVIGFSLDGTGYGEDGTIWGGEILLADELQYQRVAHFRPTRMPGGEKAIKEPWRMATAYCRECGISLEPSGISFNVSDEERRMVEEMLVKNINSPVTTSCGRLFDAIAALVGLKSKAGYEGQAAMLLEARLENEKSSLNDPYEFDLKVEEGKWIIDWEPVIYRVIEDVRQNVGAGKISWRFHEGLVNGFVRLAHILKNSFGESRIVLSGGCFQNKYLSERLSQELKDERFEVFIHTQVPPNDGGLSLGQAYIAANRLLRGFET
ncbi:MAG: carbamoyltransferase HypF [Calditrichia bacterium]